MSKEKQSKKKGEIVEVVVAVVQLRKKESKEVCCVADDEAFHHMGWGKYGTRQDLGNFCEGVRHFHFGSISFNPR